MPLPKYAPTPTRPHHMKPKRRKDIASSASCHWKGFFHVCIDSEQPAVQSVLPSSVAIVPAGRMNDRWAIWCCANNSKLVWRYKVSPLHPAAGVQERNPSLPLTFTRSAHIDPDRQAQSHVHYYWYMFIVLNLSPNRQKRKKVFIDSCIYNINNVVAYPDPEHLEQILWLPLVLRNCK